MTDETAANPAGEATPAPVVQEPAAQEAQAPAEGDEDTISDDLDDLVKEGLGDESLEEELVDVEYEGKTHKVPAALKDALLRQADYTRKTTEVAEQRKAIEAVQKDVEVVRNLSVGTQEAMSQAKALDLQIKALESMSIDGMPESTVLHFQRQLLTLQAEKNTVSDDIKQLIAADRQRIETERQQASEENAKARREAIAAAAKEIPNFDDKRRTYLESLAVELGLDETEVKQITNKAAYKIMHLADIGQKLLDRQRATKKVENAQAASPVPEVGGKSQAAKDPDRMTTEEWVKWREKQVAKS